MARRDVDEVEVVETAVDEETETLPTETAAEKPKAAPKEPARGDLPEGYVTPVGFAKVVTEKELHTDRNGGHEVKPQMVYSYIKNAAKEDPFPVETVTDSIGKERQAVKVEDGVAWWERKNERVAGRKESAAAKAQAKAERAAAKEAQAAVEAEGESEESATEAE